MTLERIVGAQRQGCWLRDVASLQGAIPEYVLNEPEVDRVVDSLTESLDAGREGRVINWAVLGLTRGGDSFLSAARRKGLFRLSRYGYRHKTCSAAIREIVTAVEGGELPVPTETRSYLNSVARLHTLAGEAAALHDAIGREVERIGPAGLKAALATVDLMFLLAETRGYSPDRSLSSDHLYFYSAEDLAEGFSLLLVIATERPGGWPVRNGGIDTLAAVRTGETTSLLVAAAKVRFFRELEVQVDALNYALEPDGTGGLVLTPPSPEFLQAVKYGYMRSQLQAFNTFQREHHPDRLLLKTAIEKAAEVCGDSHVMRRKSPDRYAFALPAFPPLMELLNDDSFFLEEHILLTQAEQDFLTPRDVLLALKVRDGLTLKDIVRAQRYVGFMRWYAARYLLPELEARPGVVLQSLLPALTDEQAKEYFALAVGPDKTAVLLDLLCYQPGRDKVFDVQYQPLVRTTGGYLFGSNVFAGSNLLRNVLQLTTRRHFPDGRKDPLVATARHALRSRADYVHPADLKYEFAGSASDVDVLALWGDVLFALECKNALLPAGPFELRRSYDHIQKAARQLDLFRRAFGDGGFRTWLAGRIGRPLPDGVRLVTGMLVTDRMFLGLRVGLNCVRGVHELAHFLKEGTIQHVGEERRFWAGDAPTWEDLHKFFDEDLTYRHVWESLVPHDEQWVVGRYRVTVPSLVLDMERVAQSLGLEEARRRVAAGKEVERKRREEFYAGLERFAARKLAARHL